MTIDYNDLEQQYGLPSGLLDAVKQQESGGDPNAVSPAGAIGAFQFEPATAKQYGIDPTDPDQAATGAAMMFSDLSKKYNGDLPSMLAGYNWGQGNLDKHGLENAPAETQNYIKSISAKLPKGTQYAQADTGNMTDATSFDPTKLSDAELDAQISKLQGSQAVDPSKLSDAELDAKIAALQNPLTSEVPDVGQAAPQDLYLNGTPPPPKSFVGHMGENLQSGLQSAKNFATLSGPTDLPARDKLRQKYQAGTADIADYVDAFMEGGGNSPAGQAFNAVGGTALNPVTTAIGNYANPAIASATGMTPNEVAALEMASPFLGKGIKAAAPSVAETMGKIPNLPEFISDEAGNPPPGGGAVGILKSLVSPKPVDYDPITTHSAISDAYGAAKAKARPYYDLMNEIGSGEKADASALKPALQSMVDDIQNTPFHEASPELPYLKQQLTKIGDDGTMPLNDMVRLKQSLNSNFNPKRFMQGTDTPYAKVGSLVDTSLDEAGKRIPEFKAAKTLADKNWLNTVKSPFEDNTVLKQFWKPEDYYAKKGVDSGMLEELPDPTLQRATTMLSKIKSPVQLNAIRRTLPPELADTISKAKIQDITQGEGTGRLSSAGKAIAGALDIRPSGIANTGRNLMNVISPRFKPGQVDLINAAKESAPSLSTQYLKPFQDLKASIQQQKDLAGEMRPMSYGEKAQPVLQLPKPSLVTPSPGGIEEILRNIEANRPDPEVPPQLQLPAPKHITPSPAYYEALERMKALGLTPEEYQKKYKKGGKVTPKLTHIQWIAFLNKHGKKKGYTMKDKSNPEVQKMALDFIAAR